MSYSLLYLFIQLNCGFHFDIQLLTMVRALHEIINQFRSESSECHLKLKGELRLLNPFIVFNASDCRMMVPLVIEPL